MYKLTIVAILVLTLLATGCAIRGGRSSTVRSDEGSIRRSFGESSSYDTKTFRAKHAGDYRFDIRVAIETGSASIALKDTEQTYFALSGSQWQDSITVSLEAREHTLAIETHEAENGTIVIEYRRL